MQQTILGAATARPAKDKRERARTELQNAAQWLARMTHSYAAPADEILLDFDPTTRRLVTPEIAPGVRLCLFLPRLVFQFEEDGQLTPHPFEVDGKSSTEIEAWLLVELLHRGFDRARFSKNLPYAPPDLMSGDEVKYTASEIGDDLDRLTQIIVDRGAHAFNAKDELK